MTAFKTAPAPKAVLAIVVAGISLTTFAPAAFAAGPDKAAGEHRRGEMQAHRQGGPQGGPMMGGRGGGQFLAIGCAPRAAERIEVGLVSLGYRVDATDEQKALLDALKTAALAAQADLAATCESVMPGAAAATAETPATPAERPDMLERLQARVAIDQARATAMAEVLPQFEAFFNSLTDEQKAALEPRRMRDGERRGRGGDRDGRRMMHRNG